MNSYDKIKKLLSVKMADLNINITEYQYKQIFKYYEMLLDWNKVMNLTAITDEEEFSTKHIYDSLLIYHAFDMNKIQSVIDIGTGAGLPGIPLKIIFPHIQITLLDSLNKRIHFLQEVIEELELDQTEAIHGRAEDFGRDMEYRESFDLCVSRAVSQLSILSEYCIPFVKVEGKFIAYKSVDTDEEIESSKGAINLLGGEIESIQEFDLIQASTRRRFVLINKITETDAKYPRKAGKPQKSPLK
jgi:16S rRNA (guanine527-N7)-methyltransferase